MKGSTKVANKMFRNFFLWIRSKEFLVFLFFLIVSGFFWGVLAIKEPAEKDLDIVVKLVGVPKNVVVTDAWPDTLKVTVRDNGYNLIGYYIDKVKPIEIRFASYVREEGKIFVSNSEIIKLLKKSLERSTEIVVVKPDKLEAYYNYGDYKKVKVVFHGNLKAADKYYITKPILTPDSVKVYATQPQLAAIDSIKTQYLRISDISKNVNKHVALQKISGVRCVPNVVTLTVDADVKRDATVDVPIEVVNLPDSIILHVFPSKVAVSYVTGASKINDISPNDFKVVVDYKDLEKEEGRETLPLELRSSPSFVERPSMAFDKVDYSIEKH